MSFPMSTQSNPRDRCVGAVQRLLQALELYDGAIDNDFGPATSAAVRQAQLSIGEDDDGIVNCRLLDTLVDYALFFLDSSVVAPTSVTPTISQPATYQPDPGLPYGPKWKGTRPPGLPTSARECGGLDSASMIVADACENARPGDATFAKTVGHLASTESGAMFGRPANKFDNRDQAQRPPGTARVTAWGVFQFNLGAWRREVGSGTAPWDADALEEVAVPVARYATVFQSTVDAGGEPIDAARSVRLWHRGPAYLKSYLKDAATMSLPEAWLLVDDKRRISIDAQLAQAGVL